MAGDVAVSIERLTFTHAHAAHAAPALRDVSLEIAGGEFVGIVGLNGAGKTTLLLALNGVVPHLLTGDRSGRVSVAGRDPASTTVRDMARDVAMVFDDPAAGLSQPTVADEVALGLENLGVPWAAMAGRIGEALAAVGLAGAGGPGPDDPVGRRAAAPVDRLRDRDAAADPRDGRADVGPRSRGPGRGVRDRATPEPGRGDHRDRRRPRRRGAGGARGPDRRARGRRDRARRAAGGGLRAAGVRERRRPGRPRGDRRRGRGRAAARAGRCPVTIDEGVAWLGAAG